MPEKRRRFPRRVLALYIIFSLCLIGLVMLSVMGSQPTVFSSVEEQFPIP